MRFARPLPGSCEVFSQRTIPRPQQSPSADLVVLREVARAAREALAVTAAITGRRPPLGARLMVRPWVLRLALAAAPRLMPLPLEVYLREHFTKVHDQTIEFMAGYIAKGKRARVDVTTLDRLLAAVAPARATAASTPPGDSVPAPTAG